MSAALLVQNKIAPTAAGDVVMFRLENTGDKIVRFAIQAGGGGFPAGFGLGDGKHISTVDSEGIALALIKAVKAEKDAEVAALKLERDAKLAALSAEKDAEIAALIAERD